MYKFIRYFNQNREKIIKIFVAIIFGLVLLYVINMMVAEKNNYNNINYNQSQQQSSNNVDNNINTNSAITGSEGGSFYKEQTNIITKFIQYCNEGNVIDAYNLLSKDCKESMYPTLENFNETYYKNNFQTSKSYNIQRWSGSTYKVDLKENALHTGKLTNESKQDFITIVNDNQENKLNINEYIGRSKLNKQANLENIDIKIVEKDVFMNQEKYTFEIQNNSQYDLYLDDLSKTSTIYIVDENGVKHVAYAHEIAKENLHIYPYSNKTIKITFSNRYITGRELSEIVFKNAIIGDKESKTISISL